MRKILIELTAFEAETLIKLFLDRDLCCVRHEPVEERALNRIIDKLIYAQHPELLGKKG